MMTLVAILVALAAQTPAQAPADKPPLTLNSPELRITIDEFRKLHEKGDVLVLDVRSAETYRNGHIPGAVSVPLDAVDGRLADLKNERRPIVTYCS
jgi:rhodanese-related sulfurtransferase